MTMQDMSGEPRSDKELQEAIDAITTVAVKHALLLPPMLAVNLMNIRQCLQELQVRRLFDEMGRSYKEDSQK